MRRVVVTGMGLVSPLGVGVEHSWKALLDGKSGARRVDTFDVEDMACKIASMVPRGDGENGTYNPDRFLEAKEQRKIGDFIAYGIAAADLALDDAGWHPKAADEQNYTGVTIGSGIGGIEGIAENALILHERGPRRISPFFITGNIINLVSGQVSIRHGLKGPNHAVVTACSTGAHAIGDASRMIAFGDAEVMVAGGAEAPIGRLALAGFAACKALSTHYNDTPQKASRPYDRDRDGFVIAEGAGVLVLEELEHAKARGARIYAEVVGYGATSDGYDMVAPSGEGAARCMRQALSTVEGPVDYINAHGTSTPVGDVAELKAIREVFGGGTVPGISSTKSLTGHSLGATGVQEAIYCLLMMRDGFTAASANIQQLDEQADGLPILTERLERAPDLAISNSFGFGGTNATLALQRWQG